MPASFFGRYEIREEIGRGGMAHVYLAYDPTFRRPVAIKVLPPHYLENPLLRARFEREARLIATIEHPAIVPVYDFGEQDGQLYLVMRYMPGGSLVSLIRQGPFSLAKASELLALLSPALDAVHARGIVHRDLKPGNILLDAFGNPALSDFGIAHLSEATVDLTGAAIIGTPAYMSPEQVRAEVALDGRSDIYSLGIILYEMLTGRQPYQAATPMSIAMRHLTDPVPEIQRLRPDLPGSVQAVLDRALAKDRDQRYPRAADLSYDLRALVDASPPAGNPQAAAADATEIDLHSPPGALPPTINDPASQISTPAVPSPVENDSQAAPPSAGLHGGGPAPTKRGINRAWLAIIPAAGLLVILIVMGVRTLLPSGGKPALPAVQPEAALDVTLTAPATPAVETAVPTASATNPAPTSPPTLQPTLPPTPVFFDDFSTPANGWPQDSLPNGSYSYQGGAYSISVLQNDLSLPAVPDSVFSDLRMTVEVRRGSGDKGYYGVLCRVQDAENYYFFILRPDGYFEMGRYQLGSFTSLTSKSGGWIYHAAIQTGDATNHLQAECEGDQLRFFVNDELLWQASDNAFSAGKPGLVVAALDDGGFQALFDDFTVYSPVP
jgi:serine/threonine protein kinase